MFFSQTVYGWGSILERKELATLTGRAPELCQLCGWALCPGLVLLNSVNSVAGLCVQAGRGLTYAPERRAQSALCREKDREREA